MNKLTKVIIPVLLAILVLLPVSQLDQVEAASKYEDGEYSVPFTVLKGGSDEASMSNQYIKSPAKVIVKDGKNTVQITIESSSMLKDMTINGSGVTTVSEGNDTRVVQFMVGNLDQNVNGSVHVSVPDLYEETHDIRFNFNTSKIPGAAVESVTEESETDEAGVVAAEDNAQTGDNAPILLFAVVLLVSGFIFIRKVAIKQN